MHLRNLDAKMAVSLLAGVALTSTMLVAVTPQAAPQAPATAPAGAMRFTTLPGFTIERLVPAGKTDSYVVLTFDSLGRPVVSKELDHPRLLIDADKDGVYESEKVFSTKVRNCQGLWFDGRTLYGACAPGEAPPSGTAGEPPAPQRSGLYRMEDTNGDDEADTFEELAAFVGGIQEHGPHAIRRGPDGEMTIMIGNNTYVADESRIDPLSPFRDNPESQLLPALPDGRGFGPSTKEGLHGTLHRFNRTSKTFTVLSGALRNAYDHAFNLAGEAFTFDSDMEWDINMPWYREVRTVHLTPGSDNGYRNGSGKFPSYYLDSLPPVRDLGRGSPVGVEFYQHHVYPAEFHDAYLEADWSRGRILWTALVAQGAGFRADEGEGRVRPRRAPERHRSRSRARRVRLLHDWRAHDRRRLLPRPLHGQTPRSPRPPASSPWSASHSRCRAGDGQRSRRPGRRWARRSATELEKLRTGRVRIEPRSRAGAAHPATPRPEAGQRPSEALVADKDAKVRAAAVYVAGQHADAAGRAVVAAALKDKDPVVLRRAAEALVRQGLSADAPSPVRRRRPVCAAQLARSSCALSPAVWRCSARLAREWTGARPERREPARRDRGTRRAGRSRRPHRPTIEPVLERALALARDERPLGSTISCG